MLVRVLGVAYKKNVDDMRKSLSVVLMERLTDLGAEIAYSDPHIQVFPKLRGHRPFDLSSVALTAETIVLYDCALLATNHDRFDYGLIRDNAQLIVDTRGRYLDPADHIVKS